jgi:hypothetical protein
MMRAPPVWLLFAAGIGLYLLAKRSGAAPKPQAPAMPTAAQVIAPLAPPTFLPEWAGADLFRETGSVLPSGAARELIR